MPRVVTKSLAVAAVAAALAALGIAGPAVGTDGRDGNSATEGPAPRVSPGLAWGACPADLSRSLRCGTLAVPLDHEHPDGRTTTLAVSLAQATGRGPKAGTILVNPGGPGGRGMWLAAAVQQRLPADLRDRYDIVGIDPRGNGHSSPVQCVDTAVFDRAPKPDPVPRTEADKQRLLDRARTYAEGCAARGGDLLPHMSTAENARDMDDVRAALGEAKVSYLGWSYGTYLGAVYGQLFPQRVDKLILDSVVDPSPRGIWYGVNLDQDIAFQHRWREFIRWAGRHDDVLKLGADAAAVEAAFGRVLAGVRAAPAGNIGPAEVYDMVTTAMYDDDQWRDLALAFSGYLAGDPAPLGKLYEPPSAVQANMTAVYTAVECNDAPWPRDWSVWNRDADALNRANPILTWPNTWLNAPCLFWKTPPRTPLPIDGRGLSGALLVQAENDAATPLVGGVAMHRALPASRLVTLRGEGNHGVLIFNPNDCVSDVAWAYLRDGTLPSADVVCAGGHEPDAREAKQ
ncbi:alpha/beta hydrolase [Uniformispora flossi]|uniref:alpha/beta hydrolase n=1 Tax=Uniformispora flossi TaxID=3390723 RepID=UPI003C308DA2